MPRCFQGVFFVLLAALLFFSAATILAESETANPASLTLTNITAIRRITVPEIGDGLPIRLEGIVTFVDASHRWLVLQDKTGALAVNMDSVPTNVTPGQRIILTSQHAAPTFAVFPEFPLQPDGSELRPAFGAPTNWGNFYLSRMTGFVTPAATGDYKFWITSKGASELWLSTNGETLTLIGSVPANGAALGQWKKYPTQSSSPIHLEAGQTCRVVAFQEHHSGHDDHLSVAWQGPGMERSIIGGDFLSLDAAHRTDGILREYWTNFFVAAIEPLTSPERISAITLNDSSIQVLEQAALPKAKQIEAGAAMKAEDDYCWSEVEGIVDFASTDKGMLLLELTEGKSRIQARVSGWTEKDLAQFEKARVRLRGVCEGVHDVKGDFVTGVVWAPSPNEIIRIETDAGSPFAIKMIPINELKPENPALAWGRTIRVRGTVLRQDTNGFIVRGADSFCGYVSTNGTAWEQIAPATEVAMNNSAFAGLSVAAYSRESAATAVFGSVAGLAALSESTDVYASVPPGKIIRNAGEYTVRGGGSGVSSSYDQFYYVYQPQVGETEIIARVKSVEGASPRAMAGIMIRNSLGTRAAFANVGLTAGGDAVFQFRQKQNERGATVNVFGHASPYWLKLTRRQVELRVFPKKSTPFQLGQKVELIGSLKWRDGKPILVDAHSIEKLDRKKSAPLHQSDIVIPARDDSSIVPLDQVIPDEGEALVEGAGAIRIRGVVTFSGNAFGANYLAIQDQTAGVFVHLNSRFARRPLQVGDWVELNLATVNGKWRVPLEPTAIQVLGRGLLPEPALHPAEYLLTRRGDAHWTEFEGVVREATDEHRIVLMCRDGRVPVWIDGASTEMLRGLVNVLVRVRGVLVRFDESTRAVLTPSPECIHVIEPAPETPFEIPRIAISALKHFDQPTLPFHRVKVSGVVTYRNDGLFLVQDESGGVRIRAQFAEARVGDLVEAAGFPDMENGFVSLNQSVLHTVGVAPMPVAVNLNIAELQKTYPDARMVRLSGQLLDQHFSGENQVLELKSGRSLYRAVLRKSHGLKPIPIGSIVETTGVCWMERNGSEPVAGVLEEPLVASFQVLMRTPADVVVRQRPPWWTWKHTAGTIGALLFVLAAALVWIQFLRRRVTRRTHDLQTAMNRLERETEISATLAERNRLAGEIHDGLEQGLSAIMMQLDGLELKLAENPVEAVRHLKLARNMVRFSRTEVRHSLWQWKSPALANKDLASALAEIGAQMGVGNHARVAIEVTGSPFSLPPATEHNLLRIGQEAINNALKYANAETIQVALDFSEQSVRLRVRDDGRGFVPETALSDSVGHLGLQNLRSRARQIGGHLTVLSAPGQGTTIEVAVPVTEKNSRRPNSERSA